MLKLKGAKYWLMASLAAIPCGLYCQESGRQKPSTVAKMCGRVTELQTTRAAWSYSYEVGFGHPRKAEVFLYRREEKKSCCGKEAPILKLATEADGKFDFKDTAPGEYWVVVVVGKKQYTLPITLDPSVRNGRDCSGWIYQIKEDTLRLVWMEWQVEWQ